MAIKLSSWRWRGRQALRLQPRAEVGTVADTVLALLEKLEEEESVLVEAVCLPARMPFAGESCLGRPGVGPWLSFLAALCWAQASPSSSRQSSTRPRAGCADLCCGVSDTGRQAPVEQGERGPGSGHDPTAISLSNPTELRVPEQREGRIFAGESGLPLGGLPSLTLLPSSPSFPAPLPHQEPCLIPQGRAEA